MIVIITKRILNKQRIRQIDKGFSFIPHRFIAGGFLQALSPNEILLYFFLTLVADRQGLSFYSYDSICNLIGIDLSEYIEARNSLIERDLICFKNNIYQVLSLPDIPVKKIMKTNDSAAVRNIIMQSLSENNKEKEHD